MKALRRLLAPPSSPPALSGRRTPSRPPGGPARGARPGAGSSGIAVSPGKSPRPPRARARAALRRFARCEAGGSAVDSALAIAILVTAFAGLMAIVETVYTEDRMGRGARAVARSIALNPYDSDGPWNAMENEGLIASAKDCKEDNPVSTGTVTCGGGNIELENGTCDDWTLIIQRKLLPEELPGALETCPAAGAGAGDLVLVRVEKSRLPWSFVSVVPDAQAAGTTPPGDQNVKGATDADAVSDTDQGAGDASGTDRVRMVAFGLVRSEPEG